MFDLKFELANFEHQLQTMIDEAKSIQDGRLGFSQNIEELLAEIIDDNDEETLRAVLDRVGCLIPKASLSRALLRSCDRLFVKGVNLLLIHGAECNEPVQDFRNQGNTTTPLNFIINRCGPGIIRSVSEGELRRNGPAYLNMASALIANGANVMTKDCITPYQWTSVEGLIGKKTIALHKLAFICQYGPELCEKLVESTPTTGIQSILDSEMKCSPLTAVLSDLIAFGSGPNKFVKVARVISYAIVPLLQAGASMEPDPFDSPSFISELPVFWQNFELANGSTLLWGKKHGFIELLFEMRRRTKLDTDKFLKTLTSGMVLSPENLLEYQGEDSFLGKYARFCSAVRQSFPEKLQSLCRRRILENLPVGLKQRRDAIDELTMLPYIVRKYLNFGDLFVEISIC